MPGSPPRPLHAAAAEREVLGGAWVPAGAPASHPAPKGQEAGPGEAFLPPAPDRPGTQVSGRGWGERAPCPLSLWKSSVGVSSVSNVNLNVWDPIVYVSSMGVSNTPAVCLQAVLGVDGDFQCHVPSTHSPPRVGDCCVSAVSAVQVSVHSGLCVLTHVTRQVCVYKWVIYLGCVV